MIKINLIPLNRQKVRKSSIFSGGFNIPLEVVIGLGGGLLMILICVHVMLLFVNIRKMSVHKDLKKQWEQLSPEKNKVDAVIAQMRGLQGKLSALEEVVGESRVLWSQKLNIISHQIPRGVWLNRIALDSGVLFIEGSSVSRQTEAMINVHSFITNLNGSELFMKNFDELEISSIQRRKVNKVELADFLITTDLK